MNASIYIIAVVTGSKHDIYKDRVVDIVRAHVRVRWGLIEVLKLHVYVCCKLIPMMTSIYNR